MKKTLLLLCALCLSLSACSSPKPSTQIKETNTLPVVAESTPVNNVTAEPAKVSHEEWVGEWNWDQSDEYNESRIEITAVDQDSLTFNLHAFHSTDVEHTNTNIGDIDLGVATITGNKAKFIDKLVDPEEPFILEMTLENNHIVVDTNSAPFYFGLGVNVEGSYTKGDPTDVDVSTDQSTSVQNKDFLITPGKSIGKISLGMNRTTVTKLLGKPTSSSENEMTYQSTKNHILITFKDEIVKQIEFTSPSFTTVDGVSISNFEDNNELFTVSNFQWRYLQIRYDDNRGGLSFISFNADVPDDVTEYQHYVRGYIYEGNEMYEEPISGAEWKREDASISEDIVAQAIESIRLAFNNVSEGDYSIGEPKHSELGDYTQDKETYLSFAVPYTLYETDGTPQTIEYDVFVATQSLEVYRATYKTETGEGRINGLIKSEDILTLEEIQQFEEDPN